MDEEVSKLRGILAHVVTKHACNGAFCEAFFKRGISICRFLASSRTISLEPGRQLQNVKFHTFTITCLWIRFQCTAFRYQWSSQLSNGIISYESSR